MPTQEFAVSLGRLMANHLWQSTGFAAVAILLVFALRANTARARYCLWLATSVKFLVPFSTLAAVGSSLGRWLVPTTPVSRLPFAIEEMVQPFAPLQGAGLPAAASVPAPATASLLPALLLAFWFCGFAAVLLYGWVRWRRVAAAVRASLPLTQGREVEALRRLQCRKPTTWGQAFWPAMTPSGVISRASSPAGLSTLPKPTVSLVSSTAKLEPGVFGIFRPVLWLPAGIADRLDDAELEAILAHELCHVRRRDNLFAVIHMAVEAIFWFHPLVRWLGACLTEERERACDEEVVRMGGEPQIYAESILKVCEFYLASPVACAAGVTGGELKKRIEGIMTNRFARKLSYGKKLLLASVAFLVIAGPIVMGLMNPARSRAQAQTAAPLSFDVASVKVPLDQGVFGTRPRRSPGRFTWTTQLAYLIGYAYRLEWDRISGASGTIPGWGGIYEVAATMSSKATEDQIRLMMRSLLSDRFKMVSHFETKNADGWALSVAKNGPKIHEAKEEDPAPPFPDWERGRPDDRAAWDGTIFAHLPAVGVVAVIGRRVSMLQLCDNLERSLRTAVWDETGMKGNYYLAFRYLTEDAPLDADAPPLNAALQGSLGLKIEKRKGPVEMLVIDHIEKTPTEN